MQKLLTNLSDITSPQNLEKKILEYVNKKNKKDYKIPKYMIENNKFKSIIDKI